MISGKFSFFFKNTSSQNEHFVGGTNMLFQTCMTLSLLLDTIGELLRKAHAPLSIIFQLNHTETVHKLVQIIFQTCKADDDVVHVIYYQQWVKDLNLKLCY